MRPEAYTVGYDSVASEREIRDNILYYLGEYRLGVKFAEFFYRVEEDSITGKKHLASVESGSVRDKFSRAIRAREERGLSAHREVAECLGFQKLEQELLNTPNNTLFIWVSPPGPREDGYGLYSFTFVGQVVKEEDTRKVRVIPYRNILTKEGHRNYLRYFTAEAENFTTDVDFLANPIVFPQNGKFKVPEDILTFIGERERFNVDWMERLKQSLGPLSQAYIEVVKKGASDEELLQALWALENYTIAIKDRIFPEGPVLEAELKQTVPYAFREWGRQAPPPTVGGSCGSTSLGTSTLMEYQDSLNKSSGFLCPNCNEGWVRGNQCPKCNITKEKWAEKTDINCG